MKRMLVAVSAALVSSLSAAAPAVYYGLDEIGLAAPSPNHDAARLAFLAAAGTTYLESFASQAVGGGTRTLSFGGAPITAQMVPLANQTYIFDNVSGGGAVDGRALVAGSRGPIGGGPADAAYFDLEFDSPVTAFAFSGFSLSNYGVNSPVPVIFVDIEGVGRVDVLNQKPRDESSINFFGIVSDKAFTRLTLFNPGGQDQIIVDNFRFAAAPPIPEPSTLALMLLGLGGVAVWAKRRAKAACNL